MEFNHILKVIKQKIIIKMKIYFRYPLNIFSVLLQPIIWLTPYYFMNKVFGNGSSFKQMTGSDNYMEFIVLGFVLASYLTAAMWGAGFSLKEEMWDGVLESNYTMPVSRVVLMISNILFEFIMATIEIVLTITVCYFAFHINLTHGILKSLIFIIPGIISYIGIGLIIGSIVLILKNANTVVDVSSGLMQGFSGTSFPIEIFPKALLIISFVLPLTYMNDSVRALIIGVNPIIDLKYQFVILIFMMFIFLALGIFIFNKVDNKCRQEGISGY